MNEKRTVFDQMGRRLRRTSQVIVVSRFDPYRWTPLLRRLCKQLSSEDIAVLALGVADSTSQRQKAGKPFPEKLVRIPHMPSPFRVLSVVHSHLALARELIHLVKSTNVDAIIFENVDLTVAVWIARQVSVCRPNLIYLCSELPVQRRQLPYRVFERLLSSHLTGIIANNSYRVEFIRKKLGDKAQCAVVPNSPSTSDLRVENDQSCREFFPGITKNELVLLYQGIATSDRCLIEVCEAIAQIKSGIRFLIVGAQPDESHYVKQLCRFISSRGLEGLVRIIPWMDYGRLLGLTRSADMGILLYRNVDLNHYYCAPNKLFEYMSLGVPCIASDFPEMRSIVEGEGVGIVVNPELPRAIAEAIVRLSSCEERRRHMADRARKAFRSTYSFDVIWSRQRDTIMSWIGNHHT